MRAAALLLLAAACVEPRSIELSDDEVRMPRGLGVDVSVAVDGVVIDRLDWFDLAVDDPAIASAALDPSGTHVRITGRGEGATTVRIRYRADELPVVTVVDPAAVVHLSIEPSELATSIDAMLPIRATALDTADEQRDVTGTVAWSIDDPSIARLEGDRVRGMAPGTTTLRATLDNTAAAVAIAVAP